MTVFIPEDDRTGFKIKKDNFFNIKFHEYAVILYEIYVFSLKSISQLEHTLLIKVIYCRIKNPTFKI